MAPLDPNRIDVSLSLLPEQSGQHFTDFVNSLESISKSFQAIVDNTAKTAERLEKAFAKQSQATSTGGGPSIGEASPSQFGISEAYLRQKAQAASQAPNYDQPTVLLPGGGASTSEGLQQPIPTQQQLSPQQPTIPEGKRKREIPEYEKIPRFGEYNTQDYLNFMADKTREGSLKFGKRVDIPLPNWLGGATHPTDVDAQGNPISTASSKLLGVSQTVGLGKLLGASTGVLSQGGRQYTGEAFGWGVSPTQMAQTGSDMGFNSQAPTVNIPGTSIGFSIPFFSEAAKKGYGQMWDAFKMSTQGGISKDQAKEIFGTSMGLGWRPGPYSSSKEIDDFRWSLAHTMQKERGLDVPLLAQMQDQSVRTSNASLKEFQQTMGELGPASQNAKMGLKEFQKAVDESAQASMKMGATYHQGLQRAVDFSSSTGLAPQVGDTLAQNGFVQATAMQKYGLLPQQQGLLNGGQLAETTNATIHQMMGLYHGTGVPHDTSDKFGLGKRRFNQHQMDAAMVADSLGIPVSQVLYEERNLNKNDLRAAALQAWQGFDDARKAAHGDQSKLGRLYTDHNTNPNQYELGDVTQMLEGLGYKPGGPKITHFMDLAKKDPAAAAKDLQALLHQDNRIANTPAQLQIDLSDYAKHLFRFKIPPGPGQDKLEANAGGKSIQMKQANPATRGSAYGGVGWGASGK